MGEHRGDGDEVLVNLLLINEYTCTALTYACAHSLRHVLYVSVCVGTAMEQFITKSLSAKLLTVR